MQDVADLAGRDRRRCLILVGEFGTGLRRLAYLGSWEDDWRRRFGGRKEARGRHETGGPWASWPSATDWLAGRDDPADWQEAPSASQGTKVDDRRGRR